MEYGSTLFAAASVLPVVQIGDMLLCPHVRKGPDKQRKLTLRSAAAEAGDDMQNLHADTLLDSHHPPKRIHLVDVFQLC